MSKGNGLGHLDKVGVGALQNLGPDRCVLLHDLPLVVVQLPRLEQDMVWNTYLAHVVHGSGIKQAFHNHIVEAKPTSHTDAVLADALDVGAGIFVSVLCSSRQSMYRVKGGQPYTFDGLPQFFSPFLNHLFQMLLVRSILKLEPSFLECPIYAQDNLIQIERLSHIVVSPIFHTVNGDTGLGYGGSHNYRSIRVFGFNFRQYLSARFPRHLDIENHQINWAILKPIKSLGAVSGFLTLAT